MSGPRFSIKQKEIDEITSDHIDIDANSAMCSPPFPQSQYILYVADHVMYHITIKTNEANNCCSTW